MEEGHLARRRNGLELCTEIRPHWGEPPSTTALPTAILRAAPLARLSYGGRIGENPDHDIIGHFAIRLP